MAIDAAGVRDCRIQSSVARSMASIALGTGSWPHRLGAYVVVSASAVRAACVWAAAVDAMRLNAAVMCTKRMRQLSVVVVEPTVDVHYRARQLHCRARRAPPVRGKGPSPA